MHRIAATAFLALAFLSAPLAAQEKDQPRERSEEEILKTVKLPEGYAATVFAKAPAVGYPTSVSAAIDGTLFVAVDENGSIGRTRNEPGKPRGKVLRLRDTDGDGRADEIRVFAEMESPRGVIWDGLAGAGPGTLYVMHPPSLTAFIDADGDGVADRQDAILSGLGFDLGFRGADHTTNGCRLAPDGFIYIAVGDYGFTKATAKDGTSLSMRGGGIVRVRPDGTGFEIVSRGQRNICDVAISPQIDLFTRDNTNDGGGWNVRLSHVPQGAEMGYPTRFIHFPEDIVQPLADLGSGSPCGALWIEEPGLEKGLYTVEWGRNAIMHHRLSRQGAGWKHEEQTEWLKLVRPTDIDVDASGAIFISSWEGATFEYNGPNAGYILRVLKKDAPRSAQPALGAGELKAALASESATLRLAAQREAIRLAKAEQHWQPRDFLDLAQASARVGRTSAAATAWFAFAQTSRDTPPPFDLAKWKASPAEVRWLQVQVLAHGAPHLDDGEILIAGLADADARVRAAAITGLRRKGKTHAAPDIAPLVADADPLVAHLAGGALSEWKASAACLAALDAALGAHPPDARAIAIADGALRALYAMAETAVVQSVIERLKQAPQGNPLRRGILNALCRLANIDAPYLEPKEWWGTRPDTSGPVYKPIDWEATPAIVAALKAELDSASEDDARWLIQRMVLTKVNFPGLIPLMLEKAGRDTAAKLTAIEGLFRPNNSLPKEAIDVLGAVAADAAENPELRARALRLLQRGSVHGSVFPSALAAFAPFAGNEIGQPALAAAFEDFSRDGRHTKWIGDLSKIAADKDAPLRTLAQTILVNLATSSLVQGADKEKAGQAVAGLWAGKAKPEVLATLLAVAARTGAKQYAAEIRSHLDHPENAVAEAALFAVQKLGLGDDAPAAELIGTLPYEEVFAAVQKGGDAAKGRDVYLRSGCIACHTITHDEPPKGPVMSAAARIYDRAALTESILRPSAKLAQGFESTWIRTKKGEHHEGFVTREGGDNLDLRNIAGQTVLIEKADIAERGHREQSMMPEGLLNAFTPEELAHLLAYLESLK
jgi:putative heme-binding domain-containing protein